MSVDRGLWYGLFYKKQIGVKYAHLWIDWAEYTEENEFNWAGAWGIYEESKKFVFDANECEQIDQAYRLVFFPFLSPTSIDMFSVPLRHDFNNGIKKVCSLIICIDRCFFFR